MASGKSELSTPLLCMLLLVEEFFNLEAFLACDYGVGNPALVN